MLPQTRRSGIAVCDIGHEIFLGHEIFFGREIFSIWADDGECAARLGSEMRA
jgi:hypothetical protein